MLNPMYVRLVHEQKVQEIEAEIARKIRCHEGYSCLYPDAPWYAPLVRASKSILHLVKLIAHPRAKKVMAAPCKAC